MRSSTSAPAFAHDRPARALRPAGGELAVQEHEGLEGMRARGPAGAGVWVSGASKASKSG